MSMAKAQAGILNRESANFLCKSQTVSILGTASAAARHTHFTPPLYPRAAKDNV